MIKWLIKIFYQDELQEIRNQYAKEAKKVLEDAKEYTDECKNKVYIYYDRIDIGSDEFLNGIQPVLKNSYLISWLNEIKIQWQQLVKKSVDTVDKENAFLFSVKMSFVDDLFAGLRDFEYKYNEMLNQKEKEQSGGTEQQRSI